MIKKLAKSIFLSLALAYAAEAATVSTTGIWLNPNPAAIDGGVGTSQLSWGVPPNATSPQSSYIFAGVSDGAVSKDGNPFLIGTFSHLNFPVDDPLLTETDLELMVNFGAGYGGAYDFLFHFDHYETPWSLQDCPVVGGPGTSYVGGCPDVVTIVNPPQAHRVQLGNEIFEFMVSGFQQNGQIVNQLVTYERQANTAQVFGQLNKVGDVPEPTTMVLIGSALVGLGAARRRRARRS